MPGTAIQQGAGAGVQAQEEERDEVVRHEIAGQALVAEGKKRTDIRTGQGQRTANCKDWRGASTEAWRR